MLSFDKKYIFILWLLSVSLSFLIGCIAVNKNVSPPARPTERLPEVVPTATLAQAVGTPTLPTTSVDARGTVTPTSDYELTISPVAIISPTLQPTPTISPTQVELDRVFALYSSGTFLYGALDVIKGNQTEISPKHLDITPDEVGAALSLSFSHFSDLLAFWYRSPGKPGVLWLADMELRTATPVYVDEDQLYNTDTSFPPEDVTLHWFPNDRYLLMIPTNPETPRLFMDVITGEHQTDWNWDCNSVIFSPKTSRFALLCTENNAFLVMEWDGQLWTESNISEDDIVWQWTEDYMLPVTPYGSFPSWSSDGRKIAYIDPQNPNVLQIVKDSGESVSVTFNEDVLYPHSIQWTDTSEILISGETKGMFSNWFVVDSNTGEILWSLEKTANYDTAPEYHEGESLIEGAISNSGQYVVLATSRAYSPTGNVLLLFDVNNNEYLGELTGIGRGAKFVWEH